MQCPRLFSFSLLLLLGSPQPGKSQAAPTPAANASQLVDSISRRLAAHYVFPEKVSPITAYLRARLAAGAYAPLAGNPKKLASQLQTDLQHVPHDPHLFLDYNPAFTQAGPGTTPPTAAELAQARAYWQAQNYAFKKAEILPGNVGYLPFTSFVNEVASAQPTVAAALRFVANTQALILDLRENMGGSPEMVSLLESYFFREKTPMNHLINRSRNDTTFFYADPARAQHLTLTMPLYLLTSRHTFSGAEDFAYAMQATKRAVVVGEATGGGAHPTQAFAVGQGFVASIPFARSFNPLTRTDWEGTGVVPAAKVPASQALHKAQELIFAARLQAASTAPEQRQAQYWLDELRAQPAHRLPAGTLARYAGTYGPLVIYSRAQQLYCRNTEAGNLITELHYIADNLFVLDDTAHIQFELGSSGACANVKLFVSDGNVFEERRKKPATPPLQASRR